MLCLEKVSKEVKMVWYGTRHNTTIEQKSRFTEGGIIDKDDKTSGMWGEPICLFCNTSPRLNGSLYGRGWVGGLCVASWGGVSHDWLTLFEPHSPISRLMKMALKNWSISLSWICDGSPSNLLKIKLTHISPIFLWRENFKLLNSTTSLYNWRKSAREGKWSF